MLALLDFWTDPTVIWILIPLTALAIPITAIVAEPIRQRMRQSERREARQMYERLAREKLDVVKTAITMGYTREELADLDRRLEQLVGTDKLESLLKSDPKSGKPLHDLPGFDLEGETSSSSKKHRERA